MCKPSSLVDIRIGRAEGGGGGGRVHTGCCESFYDMVPHKGRNVLDVPRDC